MWWSPHFDRSGQLNGGYWSDKDDDDEEEVGDSAGAEAMEVDIPHKNDGTSVTFPTRRAVDFDSDDELASAGNNVYLRLIVRSYKSVVAIVKPGILL